MKNVKSLSDLELHDLLRRSLSELPVWQDSKRRSPERKMTVRQRIKRRHILLTTGSYGRPVFNTLGLVIGVQVIDITKWSKPK